MEKTFRTEVIFENYCNAVYTVTAGNKEEAIVKTLNKLDERHFDDAIKVDVIECK